MSRQSWTEDLVVPARVQAELVAKLAAYDRKFLARAAGRVVIAIVTKPSDVDSMRGASQIQAAFKELTLIAGLPHEEIMVPWNGARDLADLCAKRRVAIVYLAPGLGGDIALFAKEMEAQNILTVACVLGYVAKGVVDWWREGAAPDRHPRCELGLSAGRRA